MKVIDLLNKIANGKIKYPIKWERYGIEYKIEDEASLEDFYCVCNTLNDEIEIIEEPKKIEKLEPIYKIEQDMNLDSVIAWQKVNNKIFQKKIDEIIDYINKGDSNE